MFDRFRCFHTPSAVLILLAVVVRPAFGQEVKAERPKVDPGHSYHGDFLNEGPRQRAYLMEGTGKIHFPVTTENEQARKFIEQGLGQYFGFWYLESERSFRQAAALDPKCAMAYWGAALATQGNTKRAQGFIAEAVKRKDGVSQREKMYIESLQKLLQDEANDDQKRKARASAYVEGLEAIALQFPDDIQAKALLALHIYLSQGELPINSHLAIDSLLQQVFAVEPLHSAHHFRIHLWDGKRPAQALTSAAACGQGSPAIAHMWHMPGHIYSRLQRYDDAAWQQEASTRVDHARMMRDGLLPDEIHNFAHNNEWLIRDLNHVGRVRDAVELAKNMIELPRHPKYNTLDGRGSSRYGRERLLETLVQYELWDELIQLGDTPWLDPTDVPVEQIRRLRHLGIAAYRSGKTDQGNVILAELTGRAEASKLAREQAESQAAAKAIEKAVDTKAVEQAQGEAERKATGQGLKGEAVQKAREAAAEASRSQQIGRAKEAIEKARTDARAPLDEPIRGLESATQELLGLQLLAAGNAKGALESLRKAGGVNPLFLAQVQLKAGEVDPALTAARAHVAGRKNEVQPLALLVALEWQAGKKDEARKSLEALREISSSIDMASPVFKALTPIARELGLPDEWRVKPPAPTDVGQRPELESLGPFRWQPTPAPTWELFDVAGAPISLQNHAGRPVVVIFYLGHACLHCAEQLKAFAPLAAAYADAGISLVAISTDSPEELKKSVAAYGEKFPIPLASNAKLDVFQAYRAYDDFESQPLHGTFLIDGQGLVRWHDIGHEPFQDAKFLLQESRRLLGR